MLTSLFPTCSHIFKPLNTITMHVGLLGEYNVANKAFSAASLSFTLSLLFPLLHAARYNNSYNASGKSRG